jgi:hypothetical protein
MTSIMIRKIQIFSAHIILSYLFLVSGVHSATTTSKFIFSPELTQKSILLPLEIDIRNGNITFRNRFALFELSHPSNRYRLYSYQRKEITFITETSTFEFKNDAVKIKLGRDYIKSGPAFLNSPLFSSHSSSLDHFSFAWSDSSRYKYEYFLLRLDNRSNNQETFNRWLYYRRAEIRLFNNIFIGFKDAVIATGVKRGIQLNYINPSALFQLEQLHGRTGPNDGTPTVNNDNQLMGIDIAFHMQHYKYYADLWVDEFQIDAADRKFIQDVFAITLGVKKKNKHSTLCAEYFYASPWMYLNGGMYTNAEVEGTPLGPVGPFSHGLSLALEHHRSSKYLVKLYASIFQKGAQSFSTIYDPEYNYVNFYGFDNTLLTEWDIKIFPVQFKHLEFLGLNYNLLNSNKLFVLVGFKI